MLFNIPRNKHWTWENVNSKGIHHLKVRNATETQITNAKSETNAKETTQIYALRY